MVFLVSCNKFNKYSTNMSEEEERDDNLPVFSTEEPSDEIKDAVYHDAAVEVECEMCGRLHYSEYYREGLSEDEEEEHEKYHEDNKDRSYYHHCSSVNFGYYNGKKVVLDCKCRYLKTIEDAWTDERISILKFFEAVFKKRGEQVREEEALLQEVLDSAPKE